jgi:hypothetical protein
MANKYRRILIEWMRQTTCHGISNVERGNTKILKLIWTIFILSSIGYLLYNLVNLASRFKSYKVQTSFSIVNELSVEFPAIDICNLNPSQYNDLDLKQLLSLTPQNLSSSITYLDRLEDSILGYLYIGNIVANIGVVYPYKLEQMIISCEFDGVKCDENDFYMYSNYNYGMCYRFNGGITKKVTKINDTVSYIDVEYSQKNTDKKIVYNNAGIRSSFKMELFVGNPQSNWFSNKNGIRLIVHNASDYVDPLDDGFDVQTGKSVDIGVSRNIINRLPSPYSNCIGDLDEAIRSYEGKSDNKTFTFLTQMKEEHNFNVYSHYFCVKLCRQDYIVGPCKCYDAGLPIPNDILEESYRKSYSSYESRLDFLNDPRFLTPCNPFDLTNLTEYICMYNYRAKFKIDGLQKCLDYCPLECTDVDFKKEISELRYPSIK